MTLQKGMPAWTFWSMVVAVAVVAAIEVLGSRGFAGRDEILVLEDMARRAHGTVAQAFFGNGFFLKQAQAWSLRLWGDWHSLYLPVVAAQALQALVVAWVAWRLGGRVCAQGAVLGSLCSATALLLARSLLPFAILPTLLTLSLALLLRGKGWALVAGALLAAGFLEYEGTVFALPGFAAVLLWEPRLRPKGRAGAFGAGFIVGALVVLFVCRHSLAEWWAFRRVYSAPFYGLQHGQVLRQLGAWAWGGHPEPYLGVDSHPFVALWALPLVAIGLATQTRRRPWLLVWILGALPALLPSAGAFESQRTVAALPALVLAAGFGWSWAWRQVRPRPWMAGLLIVLPFAGFAVEQRAFEHSMRLGQERYGRSQAWMAAAKDPRFAAKVDAMLMPSGLAIESIVGAPKDKPEWVWLPGDLGEDSPAWPGIALYDNTGRLTGDALAQVPAAGAEPLLTDLAALRNFWIALPGERRPMAEACRGMLDSGRLKTKVTRASVWLRLLQAGAPSDDLRVEDLASLSRESFKSPRFYRAATSATLAKDPRLTYWLLWLLRQNCGDEHLTPGERQILAVPWDLVPSNPSAPLWPRPPSPS